MKKLEKCEWGGRNLTIDILKGIGIILMVAGHCYAPFTSFIYLFHMAIFFIAAGYCFNKEHASSLEHVYIYALKKLKSLWMPYVLGITVFTLLNNFFIKINVYTNNSIIYDYVSGPYITTIEPISFIHGIKKIVRDTLGVRPHEIPIKKIKWD